MLLWEKAQKIHKKSDQSQTAKQTMSHLTCNSPCLIIVRAYRFAPCVRFVHGHRSLLTRSYTVELIGEDYHREILGISVKTQSHTNTHRCAQKHIQHTRIYRHTA